MEQNKKTIWIVIDHPIQVIDATGLAFYFSNNYKVKLLVSRFHYWDNIDPSIFEKAFDKIYWFEKADFSKHLVREIFKLLRNKKKIKNLGVEKGDIFFILSRKVFLENLLISLYKDNLKINFSPIMSKGEDGKDMSRFKERMISRFWNKTIIPLFGMCPLRYYYNVNDRRVFTYLYSEGNLKLFNEEFFYKSFAAEATLENDEFFDLSYYVKDRLAKSSEEKDKKIVFFGDAVNQENYTDYHIDFANKCLRYIEKFFPECELLYKPHPFDKMEKTSLEMGRFKLVEKAPIAELFLITNADKIKCVFSVSSLALKSALDMGFKGYYFLNMYEGYSEDYRGNLTAQAGYRNKEVFLKNFEEPPLEYESGIDLKKIENSLNRLKEKIEIQ